jgi:ribosomal protein S18 acetylase RimI-like enzyme
VTESITVTACDGGAGVVCRRILDRLPDWFGFPEANDSYVAMAEIRPGVIASVGGAVDDAAIGITTVVHHSPHSSEIHLIAVVPEWHRHGIGTMMLREVERGLAADGVEFLQVKTLGPSNPDPGYALTRAFYLAYGFRWLEEFPTLWSPDNPALQLIKRVAPA